MLLYTYIFIYLSLQNICFWMYLLSDPRWDRCCCSFIWLCMNSVHHLVIDPIFNYLKKKENGRKDNSFSSNNISFWFVRCSVIRFHWMNRWTRLRHRMNSSLLTFPNNASYGSDHDENIRTKYTIHSILTKQNHREMKTVSICDKFFSFVS